MLNRCLCSGALAPFIFCLLSYKNFWNSNRSLDNPHIADKLKIVDTETNWMCERPQGGIVLGRVGKYIKPYTAGVIIAALMKAGGSLVDLALPYITSIIIDDGVANGNLPIVVKYGIIMLVISICGALLTLRAHRNAVRISQDFAKDVRNGMFEHIQSYSLKELEGISTSSLITRITNDVQQVQQLLMMTMRMFMRTPVLALGGSIMAFVLDPKLSLILLVLLPFLYLVMQFTLKKTKPIYKQLQLSLDRLTTVVRENLTGVKVIKAFGRQEYEKERFYQRSRDVKEAELGAGMVLAVVNPMITLLMNMAVIAVVWFGGLRVNAGGMQTGKILAYLNYLTMILNSFTNISKIFSMCTRASASGARINQVFDTFSDIRTPDSPQPLLTDQAEDAISFENVSFTYPGDTHPSLENVSFHIEKGRTLAIIGPTGCGKSTLVNLLIRFYDPDQGKILVGGTDVKEADLDQLRTKVAVVLQKTMLFSGTIAENIRWGNPNASIEQIQEACSIAQMDSYISQLPEQYDTQLSQGAVNLSGGQKQRISIARGVIKVKQGDILVMDDSSSALDFTTDLKLRQAVKSRLQGRTLVIIAQRISTVMNADRILVMNKGKVVGFGSHSQLLESCPIYQEIYRSQMGVSQEQGGAVVNG